MEPSVCVARMKPSVCVETSVAQKRGVEKTRGPFSPGIQDLQLQNSHVVSLWLQYTVFSTCLHSNLLLAVVFKNTVSWHI